MKREFYAYGIVGVNGLYDSLKEARAMYRHYTTIGHFYCDRVLGAANMCPNHKCIYRLNLLNEKRTYFKP